MTIITVPHATLRTVAQPITELDDSTLELLTHLGQTLTKKKNPQGVGLAAPQVNHSLRAFCTFLAADNRDDSPSQLRLFINPVITRTSPNHTFGPNKKEPVLEGCLSIPSFYGPVPRWTWVEVEYQELDSKKEKLLNKTERFDDFAARVMQHEADHLDGILFTDYSLRFGLPVYRENAKSQRLEEIDPEILRVF